MAATAEEKEAAARQKADRAEDANWAHACTGCGFSRRLQLSPVGDTSIKVVVRHRRYVPYALGDPPVPAHMADCPGSLQPPADPVATWPAYYGEGED